MGNKKGVKRWLEACMAAVVLAALAFTLVAPYARGRAAAVADASLTRSDFGAFYCAALVVREGGDPYKFAPLRRCEIDRVYAPGGATYAKMGIDPAPLPLYDLALFAPFTLVSYRLAGLLWIATLFTATLASAAALTRLTRLPFAITLAALAVTDGTLCFEFGQQQPLVTLALVGAALLLRAEKTNAAVAVASLSLIEPHVGLPSMLALFVWTRRRFVAAACIAAFALVALDFGGVAMNVEYFARVLPAHAFAEIPVWFQYSFTSILHAAGVPDVLALRLASLQYALTAAVAVACAGPLSRRMGASAIVLFPAAGAVLGGPFIHLTQIASAIPFALVFATFAPAFSVSGWAAAVLLGLQWPATSRAMEIVAFVLLIGAALALRVRASLALRFAFGIATFALYLVLNHRLASAPFDGATRPLTHAEAVAAAAPYDASLASTRLAVDARESPDLAEFSARRFAERFPGWLALIIVFGAGVTLSCLHVEEGAASPVAVVRGGGRPYLRAPSRPLGSTRRP